MGRKGYTVNSKLKVIYQGDQQLLLAGSVGWAILLFLATTACGVQRGGTGVRSLPS